MTSTEHMEKVIIQYIEDRCEEIDDEVLLSQLLLYGQKNTDAVIGFGWALVLLYSQYKVKNQEEKVKRKFPHYGYRKVNGIITRVEL